MTRRYVITVDQEALRLARPAIHIHNTETDTRRNAAAVSLPGPSVIVSGPERQDGARVWIETDRIVVH